MGVTKTILAEGNGQIPKKGDTVTIQYTGYLKDTSKPDNKGDKYVFSSLNWLCSASASLSTLFAY